MADRRQSETRDGTAGRSGTAARRRRRRSSVKSGTRSGFPRAASGSQSKLKSRSKSNPDTGAESAGFASDTETGFRSGAESDLSKILFNRFHMSDTPRDGTRESRRRSENGAAKRRSGRRHRRIETGYLFRFLSMFVIFVCVFAALTMFFRVKTVAVTGEWIYTAAEIQKASGVADGDNLFFLNKFNVRDKIYQALPYLEEVRIRRELPDTLVIEVKECRTPMEIDQDGTAWIFNSAGKIIDRRDIGTTRWARVTGCRLLSPSLGTYIALDTNLAVKQESLLNLMTALRDADMTEAAGGIHLEEASCLRMDYAERFSVKLPYAADYPRKLRTLEKLLQDEKIQDNMTGTFDLTRDEAQYFQPDE